MKLLQHRRPVQTIFDLLGTKENDMTAALAFVLSCSSQFLESEIREFAEAKPTNMKDAIIRVQTGRRGHGITDIEIECGTDFFAVMEAKRGPDVPSRRQLECYTPVVKRTNATHSFLVSVSNATNEFAAIKLSPPMVRGIPLVHLPWRSIRRLAQSSSPRNERQQAIAESVHQVPGRTTRDGNEILKFGIRGFVVAEESERLGVVVHRHRRKAELLLLPHRDGRLAGPAAELFGLSLLWET